MHNASADPDLTRNFTGRDPWIEPLLKRRGLKQPAEPKARGEAPPPSG